MTTSRRVILALMAASIIAALVAADNVRTVYVRLSYLFVFLYIGSWVWSLISLRGLQLDRSARAVRAQVGQIFEERFEIHNSSRLSRLWVEVRDQTTLPGSEGSRVLTMLRGKQGRSYLARTRLICRGSFPLGPTVLEAGDVFGIFIRSLTIPARESLLVYPMMVDVSSFPNPPGVLPGGEALRRRTHQVTPNAAGVREYVHGDPMNRIHWLSSARRNRLMVKEFELDPLSDVWIFLDAAKYVQAALPEQTMEARVGDIWERDVKISLLPSTEEYGVSIAASLVRYYLRCGRTVGLVSAGQFMSLIPPDRGGRQLGKILESLTLLRAEGMVPLRGLVETQAKHIARGSTVVLITPAVLPEISVVVDFLMRRGLRPIVVLIDAASFGGLHGSERLVEQINLLGAPVRLVTKDADLSLVLGGNELAHRRVGVEMGEVDL